MGIGTHPVPLPGGERESGIGNRESGIGNRESGVGNREVWGVWGVWEFYYLALCKHSASM
ncbi:hypothetical protein BJP36_38285 [Moorena producens JHB]|uniref:Uncharacterized protein n=1 Tax=Moorena producens (strain JHB) TaxID=1454205 RepID=A0A9Q9UWJ0_MOOP1|nr:hypothetical protein [Moorena producens]WAN69936.1 hypothetical protein BJP36_38285 [Moorena producens JHB]